MKKGENHHFQQFIDSFEYRAKIELNDSQRFSLVLELESFVNQVLSEHWRNLHEAHRQTEKTFRRTFQTTQQ